MFTANPFRALFAVPGVWVRFCGPISRIAPIGLLLRAFGTDPMERRIQPDATTYWVDAPSQRANESYFKQF